MKKQGVSGSTEKPVAMRDPDTREQALANREAWVRAREIVTGEHDIIIAEREEQLTGREQLVKAREETLRARAEALAASNERDRLLAQLRDANERLVLAAVRAEEAAEIETRNRLDAENLTVQLQSAGRAKNEFLAMLGHELRNPLAPILSALDVMAVRAPAENVRERAVIVTQVQQLVRLVDDLLDLSRADAGKIDILTERVALDTVVTRAIETVAPLIREKRHTIKAQVGPGLTIVGDPIRLNQIVSNLVANAAKYTPPNGTIQIFGERRGTDIVLRVRDNGIGISSEMLPRVFEPFAQEDRVHDRADQGLGLGLAIVQRLVDLHGGTVTVESGGVGCGTEFVVILPSSSS
jgi:signal transduction histidine kinase